MATAEQTGLQVPAIEERQDLLLSDASPAVHRAGSIAAAAARAAEVAHITLGVDKQAAKDIFTGQLETMGEVEGADDLVPVVHVTVGAEDNDGHVWTPSHVVKGHDALTTKGGQTVPETYIWTDMYANRPAAWWNKTRPDGTGESELVEAPLQIVLADAALRGTSKKWDKQQAELTKIIKKGSNSDNVTVEGMPILSWQMMDADAIIGDTDRPDTETATRFVQHEMDRVGGR